MTTVFTACCNKDMPVDETLVYRKKRWCGNNECLTIIDEKVKIFNQKKRDRKKASGTYRSGVDKETRERILERDKYACAVCNIKDFSYGVMQVHHIVPVSYGGSDDHGNLVTVCKPCHGLIHDTGWEEYVTSLAKNFKEMG